MADDMPAYRAFLLTRACRCAPCVMKVEVHHPRHSPTYAPGEKPAKSVGDKPGKNQRSSDWYGIPACPHHHTGNLHKLSGYFKGWSGEELRAWEDEQIEQLHAEYEAYLEANPDAPRDGEKQGAPARRVRAAGAGADESALRLKIAIEIREHAAARHLKDHEHALVMEIAEMVATASSFSTEPTRCTECGEKSKALVQGICSGCRGMMGAAQ